jgi:hypothetical protein
MEGKLFPRLSAFRAADLLLNEVKVLFNKTDFRPSIKKKSNFVAVRVQ